MLKSSWRPPKMQHSIHRLNYYNIKQNELAFISADLVRLRTRQRWMWIKCDFDNNFFFACSNVKALKMEQMHGTLYKNFTKNAEFKILGTSHSNPWIKCALAHWKRWQNTKFLFACFFFLRFLSAKFCFSSIFVVYLPSLSRWFFLSMSFFFARSNSVAWYHPI